MAGLAYTISPMVDYNSLGWVLLCCNTSSNESSMFCSGHDHGIHSNTSIAHSSNSSQMACGPLENYNITRRQLWLGLGNGWRSLCWSLLWLHGFGTGMRSCMREFLLSAEAHKHWGLVWIECIGPAAMACVCAYILWKSLSKCDLLTPGLRIEAATQAVGLKISRKSVTKCNKVWNCVTIWA